MTDRRVTINVSGTISQDEMDQVKRLLQGKLEQHPNCRSSVGFHADDDGPEWESQRVTSFWDAYFNRVTVDG